jgi:hypothetical protein
MLHVREALKLVSSKYKSERTMETHRADSEANVPEMSSAGSTLITKSIGYASAIVIAFVSSLILSFTARAHDPSHQYTDWFKKQRNQAGYVCCDDSDAHYLGSDEWTRVKGNYRVRIKGIWFDVEDSQTLRPDGGSNPTGNAILWYNLTEFGFNIRCFTPQYES